MQYTLTKIARETETELVSMDEKYFEFFAIPDGRIVKLGLKIDEFMKFMSKADMIKTYTIVIKRDDDVDDGYDVLQCEYIATKYGEVD